jgi:acetyl esterase/lipase
LRAFVAVAEELNFGRAAERLYISQPALSRQIRALEQFVGCELLRRSTHRVELTIAGEALLDRARKLLLDVDEAVAEALAVGGELLGRAVKLLEPLSGLVAQEAGLHEARETFERLQAEFSPPPGTSVRPVTAGGVPSLVVSPVDRPEPTVLYLHGGGYLLGSAFGYQAHAGALAAAAQSGVLVVDYRLAPEHPFPAAPEDAEAAFRWAVANADGLGADPARLAIGGDSAGGNLAAGVCLATRDSGGPRPAMQVLNYPAVEAIEPRRSRRLFADNFILTQRDIEVCERHYLPDKEMGYDPRASILRVEDLSELPPAYLATAGFDPLRDEGEAYAARMSEAGVSVALRRHPRLIHTYANLTGVSRSARAAMLEMAGAIRMGLAAELVREHAA